MTVSLMDAAVNPVVELPSCYQRYQLFNPQLKLYLCPRHRVYVVNQIMDVIRVALGARINIKRK